MDIRSGTPLKPGQRPNPLLWVLRTDFSTSELHEDMLAQVFGEGKSKRLQTWARDPSNPDGPHWIGVRNGTPLHTDPKYPRYTHQLVVRNDGWAVSGIGKEIPNDPLVVGSLLCCDTHSPHILLRDSRIGAGKYYLAVSVDSPTPLEPERVLKLCLNWIQLNY